MKRFSVLVQSSKIERPLWNLQKKYFSLKNIFFVGLNRIKKRQSIFDNHNITEALKTPPTRFEFVSILFGKPKITVNNFVYEFHHKRNGIVIWRCQKHSEKCPAKVFTKKLNCWTLNSEHNHDKL